MNCLSLNEDLQRSNFGSKIDPSVPATFRFPQPLGEGSYGRRPPEEIQVSRDLHLPLSAGTGAFWGRKRLSHDMGVFFTVFSSVLSVSEGN